MLTIYSFDKDTRAYTGPVQLTVADADPRSPGTMLVPGDCTTEPPPRCSKGLHPFWVDGSWVVYEYVEVPDPAPRTPPRPPRRGLLERALSYVRHLRYQHLH